MKKVFIGVMRVRCVGILMASLLTTVPQQPAAAAPRMFLTWHAPYGSKRATNALQVSCGDTLASDTLYLCVDPGRDSTFRMLSFEAELVMHARGADTLGGYWHASRAPGNFANVESRYAPDRSVAMPQPWNSAGLSLTYYQVSGATGVLRLVHAVAEPMTIPIEPGRVYYAASVVFNHPAGSGGCAPVCIQWDYVKIGFDLALPPIEIHDEGNPVSFVGWNRAGGARCVGNLPANKPPAWRPKSSK